MLFVNIYIINLNDILNVAYIHTVLYYEYSHFDWHLFVTKLATDETNKRPALRDGSFFICQKGYMYYYFSLSQCGATD